ncbi:MraY family glycosyltransferase [Thermofilum pendens]|uniref:Glycosyl transferase, family 4 n=1 Tax=Thermofilum pendens (strain DSM 2475 / Hrk 5) TaxID=368408 RepID=A1RX91_THEPD|nr:glycosyltransferase 4 family protein [Thermofilum pendens]ABL77821.1 glycosyl transferase, family 4 [Thermofilum pendens Hrk 5]
MAYPDYLVYGVASSILGYLVVRLSAPSLIRALFKAGLRRPDAHKPGNPLVAHSGGVILFLGFLLSFSLLIAFGGLGFSEKVKLLAVLATSALCFAVGLLDDKLVLKGVLKTFLTALSIIPILVVALTYPAAIDWGRPVVPIIGRMRMTVIYWVLFPISIAGSANVVNMLDVLNGIVPGTALVAFAALAVIGALSGDGLLLVIALVAVAILLAYYPFNAYPARVFNGDSGSLFIGGLLGAIAVVFHLEFVVLTLLLPHILNGFFVVVSFRGLREHREVKARPIRVENGILKASDDPKAPLTLTRLILSVGGPMTEKEVAKVYIAVEVVAAVLAVASYVLTPR